jgi:LPS sulfotransferase NodH
MSGIRAETAILRNGKHWGGPGEEVEFFISRNFWASGLVRDSSTVASATVPTRCFEEVISDHRANVLICDIEGGEIELLMDADLSRIDTIMMEVHYDRGETAANRLVQKLVADGFSIDLRVSGECVVLLHRGLSLKIGKAEAAERPPTAAAVRPPAPRAAGSGLASRSAPAAPHRFVILGAMRSGANVLAANLNQFSGVVCHGRAFDPACVELREGYHRKIAMERIETEKRDAECREFLSRLFSDPDAVAVGLIMFPGDSPEALDLLLRDRDVRKILLRRSLFHAYASLLIAKQTDVWRIMANGTTPAAPAPTPKVRFVTAEFERYKKQIDSQEGHVLSLLRDTGQSFFRIWYQKVNNLESINELAKFVGLDTSISALSPHTLKQNPHDIKQKVENWREMFSYARQNGLESQL